MARETTRRISSMLSASSETYQQPCWCPPLDVYRTEGGWLIKIELAGVRPGDFELLAQGRCLTLRGFRHDWAISEGNYAYSMEIAYNQFERSLELPCQLDRARIRTEYREGMLFVHILTEKA